MSKLLQSDKRGISEVVSYVLLVVIAISISVFVYVYIEVLVPKNNASCEEDTSLVPIDAICEISSSEIILTLTLENKGRHTIEAAYVRVGPQNSKVKNLVNKNDIYLNAFSGTKAGLLPGAKMLGIYKATLSSVPLSTGLNELEIQPAVQTDKGIALCDNAVVTQTISCVTKS